MTRAQSNDRRDLTAAELADELASIAGMIEAQGPRGHDVNFGPTEAGIFRDAASEIRRLRARVEELEADNARVLDLAADLRRSVKELHDASFLPGGMPPRLLEGFPKLVDEATGKALVESAEIDRREHAAILREREAES